MERAKSVITIFFFYQLLKFYPQNRLQLIIQLNVHLGLSMSMKIKLAITLKTRSAYLNLWHVNLYY
jgi:hypothetical protein